MGYPTAIRRPLNRRALGRGQSVTVPPVTVVVTGSGSTAILTFSRPVNVAGTVPLTLSVRTFVSQAITSPTVVTITYSGAVTTNTWTLAQPVPNVSTYEGGQVFGSASGTFP